MHRVLVAMLLLASVAGGSAACTLGCPTALAIGVLHADGSSLELRDQTGARMNVTWPSGYSVRIVDGGPALVDGSGHVKARVGDRIEMGGGTDPDGVFRGCGGVTVTTPSASS